MVKNSVNAFNQPLSGMVTPRFGGIATFMRLPHVPLAEADGIDIGLARNPLGCGNDQSPGSAPWAAPNPRQFRHDPADASDYARRSL